MGTGTILILIGAGLLVILISIIVLNKISSSKKGKKLQENIKKIKQENANFDADVTITLPEEKVQEEVKEETEENIPHQTEETLEEQGAVIEDYVTEKEDDFSEFKDVFKEKKFNPSQNNIEIDDFEEFMNQHSMSRKVINTSLLERIKKLPPDIRMMILGNILDRHDD